MSPKILIIDTASVYCTVVASIGNNLIFESLHAPKRHTQLLFPMIERVLEKTELELSGFDAFAFGAGPGSFTGIRLGASVIQGFAFASAKPVIVLCNMQAIAQTIYETQRIESLSVVLDARMNDVYYGEFELQEQIMCPTQNITLQRTEATVWTHPHIVTDLDIKEQHVSLMTDLHAGAESLAHVAQFEYSHHRLTNAQGAIPRYFRGSEAWKTSN